MKPRLFFPALGLLALTMLSACASATPSAVAAVVPTGTATQVVPSSAPSVAVPTTTKSPLAVQVVATSRGPQLEATDPTTVILASGQLQLVEFFRFT
jgi:hypothetical protein